MDEALPPRADDWVPPWYRAKAKAKAAAAAAREAAQQQPPWTQGKAGDDTAATPEVAPAATKVARAIPWQFGYPRGWRNAATFESRQEKKRFKLLAKKTKEGAIDKHQLQLANLEYPASELRAGDKTISKSSGTEVPQDSKCEQVANRRSVTAEPTRPLRGWSASPVPTKKKKKTIKSSGSVVPQDNKHGAATDDVATDDRADASRKTSRKVCKRPADRADASRKDSKRYRKGGASSTHPSVGSSDSKYQRPPSAPCWR